MKKVYIALSVDILHHGHINLISQAKKFGNLIVGLLTDKAIAEYKRLPLLNWEQRKKILENITGIQKVVPQNEWDYSANLLKYKPDFMVHGDDWKIGPDSDLRKKALKTLKKYGGKLIEIPYTKGITSSALHSRMHQTGITPVTRKNLLNRLLSVKPICRFIEAHSPLSALIVEQTKFKDKTGKIREFDGFWSSSLTDSTLKGKPDIEVLEINQRLSNVNEIFDVTTKPLIIDADTGGKPEHFELNVKTMERIGISATIIEDKKGLKKNSLFGNEVKQTQESISSFCNKIRIGRNARVSDEFMIIARIESLILKKGLKDALKRADAYAAAGANAIMIHSRQKNPNEIFSFAKEFRKNSRKLPLVVVPTSFNRVKEKQFIDNGFNIVIYANHLLRASYPAMLKSARNILKHQRSYESEKDLMSIKNILELIPGTK